MAPKTRHTFNVNMMALGPAGQNDVWLGRFASVLQSWKPSSVLMMNALNGADPYNDVVVIANLVMTWGGFPIYRPYHPGDGAIWRVYPNPADFIQYLKALQADEIWYQVGNEPGWSNKADAEAACRWYGELMDLAVAANLRLILPNTPTGTPSWDSIQNGWFDILLKKFGQYADRRIQIKDQTYAQFMLGAHTYAHAGAPFAVDGVDPRLMLRPESWKREAWPTKAMIFDDNRTDDYLVLREDWFAQRYRQINPGRPDLEIAITECLFDRLGNIETQFPDVTAEIDRLAEQRVYGIPTLIEFWRKIAPHQSPAHTCADQFWWMEEIHPPYYRAFVHFSWTFHDDHPDYWRRKFNIADWWEFLDLYPQIVEQRSRPIMPPEPATYPSPNDPAWEVGYLHTIGGVLNIREQPTTKSSVVTTISRIPAIARAARNYTKSDWTPVQVGSNYGWVYWPLIKRFEVLSSITPPAIPIPSYRDRLTPEQLKLIETSDEIAAVFVKADAPGGEPYSVIDILRKTLDDIDKIVG